MSDAPEPKTLPFRIVLKGMSAYVAWEPETEDRASDLMAEKKGGRKEKDEQIKEWLTKKLSVTSYYSDAVMEEAAARGFSKSKLYSVAHEMGVEMEKSVAEGAHGKWAWSLPAGGAF